MFGRKCMWHAWLWYTFPSEIYGRKLVIRHPKDNLNPKFKFFEFCPNAAVCVFVSVCVCVCVFLCICVYTYFCVCAWGEQRETLHISSFNFLFFSFWDKVSYWTQNSLFVAIIGITHMLSPFLVLPFPSPLASMRMLFLPPTPFHPPQVSFHHGIHHSEKEAN